MNTNIRTKVVNDTNELIFKNKDLLVDNSPDSDTTVADDNVTVTIVQPTDTKYSIVVYIMEYRRSDEGEIFEADTDEGHRETFKAAKGSIYLVVLLDTSTNTTSTDYYRLNTSSRGKLTSDITIKFKDDSPATNPPKNVVITIVQTDNQTISVHSVDKGQTFTSTFETIKGDNLRLNIEPSVGYRSGDLLLDGVKCASNDITNINSNHTVSATAADALQYTLTIKQTDHQLITVTANGVNYTKDVVLPYGTTYTVSITADTGYTAGTLNKTSGIITDDDMVYATSATIKLKQQVYVAKGKAPWVSTNNWDKSHIVNKDESVPGQATVTCDGNVTTTYLMFYACTSLTSLDFSNFDTSIVTNMSEMFESCTNIRTINLSNFDTSNVTDMNFMFGRCFSLTSLDLSNFDTSKVARMDWMFYDCESLTTLDLSNFDTSKITSMNRMFKGCSGLTSLDISSFDTSKVTDMYDMFYHCDSLTSLDLSNFDTSKVTEMGEMFYYCHNLTTIKGIIDMKSCTKWNYMFYNCPKLTGVKIKNPPSEFSGAGLSASQYTIVS